MKNGRLMSKVLLDTHSWIWLMNGESRVQKSAVLKTIELASKKSELYISSISLWEVGMLEAKGRIRFQQPCLAWVKKALETTGLSVLDISPETAIESSRLPQDFHGDPADRIIVATARTMNLLLVTEDQKILTYSKAGFVQAQSFS
jgi:PIN domain nuclease of toxin-antitoxin system